MGLLSKHEEVVWLEFQKGNPTGAIAEKHRTEQWTSAYVSRVLNRARKKIGKTLLEQAKRMRLDTESILDYKGLLVGFDYASNSQVYIVFTVQLGIIVWYKHFSYGDKLCPDCPKEAECREALETIIQEYGIKLRPDEKTLEMTQQSLVIFNKLAAKEAPRYKRN
ncbi:MAG: hypothetical protein ACTSYO_04110 [Candidatus Ranarchaeia archaeon]